MKASDQSAASSLLKVMVRMGLWGGNERENHCYMCLCKNKSIKKFSSSTNEPEKDKFI
jgi:hypothetical protein